jgi:hypothetical protein
LEGEDPALYQGVPGVIGIVTPQASASAGQLWEIDCACRQRKPVLLIYGTSDRPLLLPAILRDRPIGEWRWSDIVAFLNRL